MAKIIVIDDDELIRQTLKLHLEEFKHEVFLAENALSGIQLVEKHHPNLILCDLRLPDLDGIETLENIKLIDESAQVILITAYDDISSTISAMQKGAFDYIQKPLDISQLKIRIDRALETQALSERVAGYITEDSEEYKLENSLVGKTHSMREIYKYIGQLSLNKVTVLIEGESGTGKELVSKIIHYSGNKDNPFIAVNCTALSETILESELFGHVKGSFTGAIRDKKGKFELAGEGTIFLDEISEISPNIQVKLLRVLQEKEFEKVGGESTIPMRARIIAATNKDLAKLVHEGSFREDLYYRLKVFTIEIPPLRERREDIPLIVIHFLKKINLELHKNVRKVPYEVMEMLQHHIWEGNVRELENTLMQAVVLSKGDVLEKEAVLLPQLHVSKNNHYDHNRSLDEVEKFHIEKVLNEVKWNKQKACKILDISKPTLYSKIEKYELEPVEV